jgi:hypothetical protein
MVYAWCRCWEQGGDVRGRFQGLPRSIHVNGNRVFMVTKTMKTAFS